MKYELWSKVIIVHLSLTWWICFQSVWSSSSQNSVYRHRVTCWVWQWKSPPHVPDQCPMQRFLNTPFHPETPQTKEELLCVETETGRVCPPLYSSSSNMCGRKSVYWDSRSSSLYQLCEMLKWVKFSFNKVTVYVCTHVCYRDAAL